MMSEAASGSAGISHRLVTIQGFIGPNESLKPGQEDFQLRYRVTDPRGGEVFKLDGVSRVAETPAPDLIGRDFTAQAPGQRFVGDITYLPTQEGWLYLATTIDLFNREVIGHAMAGHMRADLVCRAVRLGGSRCDGNRQDGFRH